MAYLGDLDEAGRLGVQQAAAGGAAGARASPQAELFGGGIDWVTPTDLPPIGDVRELGNVAESITEEALSKSSATPGGASSSRGARSHASRLSTVATGKS